MTWLIQLKVDSSKVATFMLVCRGSRGDLQEQDLSGFLLILDFEKVYDSVSQECVMEAFRTKGFGHRWVDWMRTCICSGKSQVLLNGQLGRKIW